MKVYFSEPTRDTKRTAQALERMTDLYDIGFLADNSKIWVDIHNFDPALWVLNDRSSLVWTHLSGDPGVVRLTEGKIRWGLTYAASTDMPDEVINLDNFPADTIHNFTYIVQHHSPNRTVSVVDKSETQQLTAGQYTSNTGVTVIDSETYVPLNKYYVDPEDESQTSSTQQPGWESRFPEPNEYTASHAIVNGASFIMSKMTKKRQRDFRTNMGDYSVTIPASYMQQIIDLRKNIYRKFSNVVASSLEKSIKLVDDRDEDEEMTAALSDELFNSGKHEK